MRRDHSEPDRGVPAPRNRPLRLSGECAAACRPASHPPRPRTRTATVGATVRCRSSAIDPTHSSRIAKQAPCLLTASLLLPRVICLGSNLLHGATGRMPLDCRLRLGRRRTAPLQSLQASADAWIGDSRTHTLEQLWPKPVVQFFDTTRLTVAVQASDTPRGPSEILPSLTISQAECFCPLRFHPQSAKS